MGKEPEDIKTILASLRGDFDSSQLEELAPTGVRVFHLKGASISNKAQFMEQIAKTMNFPAYFGHNWDALEDCLTDLAWVDAQAVILLFDGTGNFAGTSPAEWATAKDVLKSAKDYWAKEGPLRLHLVLKE